MCCLTRFSSSSGMRSRRCRARRPPARRSTALNPLPAVRPRAVQRPRARSDRHSRAGESGGRGGVLAAAGARASRRRGIQHRAPARMGSGGGRSRSIALLLNRPARPPCDVAIAFKPALTVAVDPGCRVRTAAAGGVLDGGSGLKLHLQVTAAGDVELDFGPGRRRAYCRRRRPARRRIVPPADAPITVGPGGGPDADD